MENLLFGNEVINIINAGLLFNDPAHFNLEDSMEKINLIVNIIGVLFTGVFAVALAAFAIRMKKWIYGNEKNDSITAKTITCIINLFPKYKKTMKMLNNGLNESKELEKYLNECKLKNNFSTFNSVYYSPAYDNFRDVHYFFEMLGSLSNQHEVNKETFWRFFSFPIAYYMETRNVRILIRENNCLPSYADNFNWLFMFYNHKRKNSRKKWIFNGNAREPFEGDDITYYVGKDFNKFDETKLEQEEKKHEKEIVK